MLNAALFQKHVGPWDYNEYDILLSSVTGGGGTSFEGISTYVYEKGNNDIDTRNKCLQSSLT